MELLNFVGRHILRGIETGQVTIPQCWGDETCEYIKFSLDNATYMAVEDPDDGYRSYMRRVQMVETECSTKLPDIQVNCRMDPDPDKDILEFTDVLSNKVILRIGTDYSEDYYPWCVFDYRPENFYCNENRVYFEDEVKEK